MELSSFYDSLNIWFTVIGQLNPCVVFTGLVDPPRYLISINTAMTIYVKILIYTYIFIRHIIRLLYPNHKQFRHHMWLFLPFTFVRSHL